MMSEEQKNTFKVRIADKLAVAFQELTIPLLTDELFADVSNEELADMLINTTQAALPGLRGALIAVLTLNRKAQL